LYYSDADYDVVDRVIEIAGRKGVRPAQVALAWLLRQPGVTAPIVGASKMEQLDQAVSALDVQLSDDEARQLEEAYVPHAVLGT
jgi:aryl-alcohol dehydrogenase-like predicted oxidoreductase